MNVIRNLVLQKGLFNIPRLKIGPIQNGNIAELVAFSFNQIDNLVYDSRCLGLFVGGLQYNDVITIRIIGLKLFMDLFDIVMDQVLTGTKNLGCGSIVKIENELLCLGEHRLKV